MTATAELRSIYSGPIRRALDNSTQDLTALRKEFEDFKQTVALGILKVGSLTFSDGSGLTDGASCTTTITQVTTTGRRYRVAFGMRATQTPIADVACSFNLRDNGNSSIHGERWMQLTNRSAYEHFETEWTFSGDGASHNFNVHYSGTTAAVSGFSGSSYYYLEDVGPVRP